MVSCVSKIKIQNLGFECILGTLPFERETEQPILLSVELEFDFTAAAQSENLIDTVDYFALAENLKKFIRSEKFQLIETLVWKTAEHILQNHRRVAAVAVYVQKPNAIPDAESAMAEIYMKRN